MDIRSELNEFLQKATHTNPVIELETSYSQEKKKYEVKLKIEKACWTSVPADSILKAKKQVMKAALDELKVLKTERAIRIKLRMEPQCRNEQLMTIREALKSLKKSLRENEARGLIPLMARIYPIVDQLELEMRRPPWCMFPSKGSVEQFNLFNNTQEGEAQPETFEQGSKLDVVEGTTEEANGDEKTE